MDFFGVQEMTLLANLDFDGSQGLLWGLECLGGSFLGRTLGIRQLSDGGSIDSCRVERL